MIIPGYYQEMEQKRAHGHTRRRSDRLERIKKRLELFVKQYLVATIVKYCGDHNAFLC
jgi:hypothetical protein